MRQNLIEKAKSYPFDIPSYSYILVNNEVFRLTNIDFECFDKSEIETKNGLKRLKDLLLEQNLDFPDLNELIPVLAYGSNASHTQLKEKYLDFDNVVIPSIKSKLVNFDVVYSAHFSPYGAIPATLQYSPGTEIDVFILYLDEDKLLHLHKTERLGLNYCFAKLNNIKLVIGNKISVNEIKTYLSIRGCLFINGTHIALSAINAKNRVFPDKSEEEILNLIREILDPEKDLNEFILENVKSQQIREKRMKKLKEMSRKFYYNEWELLA